MTGLRNSAARRMMCFWMAGTCLRRHLDAQVAASHHDGVRDCEDGVQVLDGLGFFQLGDDPGFAAQGRDAVAHQSDILRGAHKGDGDGVHAVFEGEFKVLGVFFRERRNAHRNAGQVDALVLAQQAAVDDVADDVAVPRLHGRAAR